MNYDYICSQVEKLRRKYPGYSIPQILKAMHVFVLYRAMGTEENAIKGFYLYNCRKHVITINSDLPAIIQRIILAHELGHVVLHKGSSIKYFQEVSLYDESSLMEKEANLFGAEMLMTDEEVLEVFNSDCTFFQAASRLNVPPEMLDFKFRIMKGRGYQMVETPIIAYSKFLKNLSIPENHDDDYA